MFNFSTVRELESPAEAEASSRAMRSVVIFPFLRRIRWLTHQLPRLPRLLSGTLQWPWIPLYASSAA